MKYWKELNTEQKIACTVTIVLGTIAATTIVINGYQFCL